MLAGDFFKVVFGSSSGILCVAMKRNDDYREEFFPFPEKSEEAHSYVERNKYSHNIYFCPQLLSKPKRTKTNIAYATCAWADLDACPPSVLLVRPTLVVTTSPNRYQGYWAFEEPIEPIAAEDLSRRIAYRHASEGADRSGWDLTQLLRVPGTRNFKYGEGHLAPAVEVTDYNKSQYRLSDFSAYPVAEGYEYTEVPFPQLVIEDGIKFLERYAFKLSGAAHTLFHQETEVGKRSERLFRLVMLCAEAGMTREEAYQVARDAKCNKWLDEPDRLWRDVCRAFQVHTRNSEHTKLPQPGNSPELVSDAERQDLNSTPCFVERYINWAKTLGDAAVQYHQAGAFIALSAVLSGSVQLPTSFGPIIPNLWFMILADTTLSRKSTAMNIPRKMLEDIDESLLMATDGSIEGFASALAGRPGKVSIFFKDEFTGLMESMTKKDYMAGMPEFFTDLYDGRSQRRRLRKEDIQIKDPRLIIFAGGIKRRMQSLVTFEHISSGFLPRFVFVTAETDVTKVKPLGPPKEDNWGARDVILNELRDIHSSHRQLVPITMEGKAVGTTEKVMDANMSPDAWNRFNQIDQTLMQIGMDSGDELRDILTPLYARLGFSILKAAVLIAASRSGEEQVIVQEEDIARAAMYGEYWKKYADDIIVNVGKGPLEHKIELVLNLVQRKKTVPRSAVMSRYHLQTSEMSIIARTLEERGDIEVTKLGRKEVYKTVFSEDEGILVK